MKIRSRWISNSSSTCFVLSSKADVEDIKIDIIMAYLKFARNDEDIRNDEIAYHIKDYLDEVESYEIEDRDLPWAEDYVKTAKTGDIIISAPNHGLLGYKEVINKVLEIKFVKGVIDNV